MDQFFGAAITPKSDEDEFAPEEAAGRRDETFRDVVNVQPQRPGVARADPSCDGAKKYADQHKLQSRPECRNMINGQRQICV